VQGNGGDISLIGGEGTDQGGAVGGNVYIKGGLGDANSGFVEIGKTNTRKIDIGNINAPTSILGDVNAGKKLNVISDVSIGGRLFAQNGSVSAPSYSFAASPSTGMYTPSANTIAFSNGGVISMQINNIVIALYNDIQFTGNSNKYIRGPQGKSLIITAAGGGTGENGQNLKLYGGNGDSGGNGGNIYVDGGQGDDVYGSLIIGSENETDVSINGNVSINGTLRTDGSLGLTTTVVAGQTMVFKNGLLVQVI
jgi:hypothetical protein